ncbi:hypothetical protein ACWENQ_37915 [Nonomuraea sp. NPDC004354]
MATSPRRPSRSTVVTTALTIGVFGAGAGLGGFLQSRAPEPRSEVLRLAAGTYQLDEQEGGSSSDALTARSLTGADGGSTLSGGSGGPPLCLAATVDWLAVQGSGEACASIPLLGKEMTDPPLLRPGNPAERSTPVPKAPEPKDPAPKKSDPPPATRMNEPPPQRSDPRPPARERDDSPEPRRSEAPAPRRSEPPAPRKSEPEADRKNENDRKDENDRKEDKKAEIPAPGFPKGTLRAVEPNAQPLPSGPPRQPVRPRPADQNPPDQVPPGQNPSSQNPPRQNPPQNPPRRTPPSQNPPDRGTPDRGTPDQGTPRRHPTVRPPDQYPTARQPAPRVPTRVPTAPPPGGNPTVRPPDDRQCLVTGPDGNALRPAVAGRIAPGCEDPAQTALPTARPAPPTGRTTPTAAPKATPRATVKGTARTAQPSMPTSLRPAASPGRRTGAPATSGPRVGDGTALRPATVEGESLPIFQDPALMRRAEEALGLDGTRSYVDANGEWDLTVAPPGTPECRDYSEQQLQAMGVSTASPASLPRDSCLWPAFIRWLYADPAPGEVSNWTKFTGLPDRNLQLVVVDPNRASLQPPETAPGAVDPDQGP